MTLQLEAVFEKGVLRPVEPLSLPEQQHVMVTITDVPVPKTFNSRRAERDWLDEHGAEYIGEWLALDGSVLVAHGPRAREVREEARRKGVEHPLMFQVPEDFGMPSAGWW